LRDLYFSSIKKSSGRVLPSRREGKRDFIVLCFFSNQENSLKVLVCVSTTPLLVLPLLVVERAHLTRLQPSADTVEVKGMIAHTPGNGTFLRLSRELISLAINAEIHNVVPTNGACIDLNIPRPQSNGVPLFYFEPLCRWICLLWRPCGRCLICHVLEVPFLFNAEELSPIPPFLSLLNYAAEERHKLNCEAQNQRAARRKMV
jgi:hypothetical protein